MPDFKKYAGLIILITLYLILSLFSIIELAHFSKFMENEMLRNKLLFTFGLTVGLPVYLGFVKSCKNIKTVRGVFEGASIVIIFFFYFISLESFNGSKDQCSEIFSILISDVISSILLYIFHKEKDSIDDE